MPSGTVLLLVGPKGSGKSHVGRLLQAELGVPFIPVEAIFLQNMRTSSLTGSARDQEGYAKVLAEVEAALAREGRAALESTAASEHFPAFLAALRSRCEVRLVRIAAPPERCLERVRGRDAAEHIPHALERVAEINAVAARVELPWDLELDNGVPAAADEIVEAIRRIL